MENNIGASRQFNEDQQNTLNSSTGNHVRENLKEFKNCVLLHEKGLAMQDGSNNSESEGNKFKHKSASTSGKTHNLDYLSENLEEFNELRTRFNERHR